jgi:hypothetical protein
MGLIKFGTEVSNLEQDLLPGRHRRERGGWRCEITIPGRWRRFETGFGKICKSEGRNVEFLKRTAFLFAFPGRSGCNINVMLRSPRSREAAWTLLLGASDIPR